MTAIGRLRWGVLGVARIATGKVIPAMQAAGNGVVRAIASRDGGRAEAAAHRLGIERWFGSYDELVTWEGIDAVYVPLPNHLHRKWTMAAARAGKHVLCEKPLALTAAQAEEMVEECRRAGVVLMEAFMYRLHPSWRRVRDLVGEGAIGELRAVHTRFAYYNDDPDNIRNRPEYGGGALMDVGCYAVNLSRLLFGAEPSRVSAAIRRDPRFGTDVVTSGLLEFGEGHATFTVSTQMEPDQSVHVSGTEGRIEVEIPFNIPPDRPTRVFLTQGGDPPAAPLTETIELAPVDQYTIQAEVFARAVLEGEELPFGPEDAIANLRVIERIVAAAD